MIACFRDSMSFEEKWLGAETIIDEIVAAGNKRGWSEQSDAVSDWRAYSGYRWHQKDKNVRGILFPDESLGAVEARLHGGMRNSSTSKSVSGSRPAAAR